MDNHTAPFQNPEAEQGALGCALLDQNLIPQLSAALFQDVRHQEILVVMGQMFRAGNTVNAVTVSSHILNPEAVGGLAYVNDLPEKTPSPASFPTFLEQLRELSQRRNLASFGQGLIAQSSDLTRPVGEIQAQAESEVLALRPEGISKRRTNVELTAEMINDLEQAALNPGQVRGLVTGFRGLDQVLWGMKPGQLIVVGGRPGQGKTSLMLQIASNVAKAKHSVAFFSLEMGVNELWLRLHCMASGVDSFLAVSGRMNEDHFKRFIKATSELKSVPLHIEDGDVNTMDKIAAHARQLLKDEYVELVCVDYLQLIQSNNRKSGRYEVVSEVSAALKQLAKQLRIPVIVGSQFNRDVEKEGRRPRMSDLRDSGSIEQDADIVLLIHHRTEEESEGRVPIELLIAKHRAGRVGCVNLTFNKSLTCFEEAVR